jgi:hypothetical protein
MKKITEQGLLDVVAEFDPLGGASPGLVAWELYVTEPDVSAPWAAAIAAGWLEPAGWDDVFGEQMWRLTAAGWNARTAHRKPGRDQ